jgi:hypothetical protein
VPAPWPLTIHAGACPDAVTLPIKLLTVAMCAPQIHELQPDGEDAIRIGKLYLVDLAGSESILRYELNQRHTSARAGKTWFHLLLCDTSVVCHAGLVPLTSGQRRLG